MSHQLPISDADFVPEMHDIELGASQLDTVAAQGATEDKQEEETTPMDEFDKRRWNMWKKVVLGLLILGFIVFVIVDSATSGNLRSAIQSFLDWVEENPVGGMFLFTLVYFVATILFVPGSILTLGAGFVFADAFGLGVGLVIGTLSVFIGASAGSIVAFLMGRYLLREWVQGLTKKYAIFEALDVALREKGLRIMSLLRLSPIIPFNAINYICGVTAVSMRDYCLSLFAILPGTVLFVFLGASAGSLADSSNSDDNKIVTIVVVVVGTVFGIFAICLTSYYAKKELNKVIQEREATSTDTEELGSMECENRIQDSEASQVGHRPETTQSEHETLDDKSETSDVVSLGRDGVDDTCIES